MSTPTTITIKERLQLISQLRQNDLHDEADLLEKALVAECPKMGTELMLNRFITNDEACIKIKDKIRTLSALNDAVLITGESGTGKELLARALHGRREEKKFVAINVAALPKELVESELFGHTRGSFTGAHVDKVGLIKAAENGTLFLDEIGELRLDLQSKLLRALQEKHVRRVGSNTEEAVDFRLVCATHTNLRTKVDEGLFRLDLYARLSTFELKIPPLRNRTQDVSLILNTLLPAEHNFPYDKVDWNNVDLSLNIRSLQQIARRYIVFNEIP